MTALDAPDSVPAEYRASILAARPDYADLPFTVAGRGWHSLAIDIGDRFIAKFPQDDEAEAALRREVRLLDVVGPRLTMHVPRMTIHDGPPVFSLHGKLPGGRLERADYARLSEDQRDRLTSDLALFLAELHAIYMGEMRAAGALPIELWDTEDKTLAPVWVQFPEPLRGDAQAAIEEYRKLGPDPLGQVYGFFDAHGWNMAFDRERGWLNGIFDFADSGFGSPHREFVQISLIAPELAKKTASAYSALTGRDIDLRRIFLLGAAMRLSEYAGALETGENLNMIRSFAVEWFEQRQIR